MLTFAFGFPRLGKKREYKRAIESFWRGKIEERELKEEIFKLEKERLKTYEEFVDKFPVGEMTFYDNILDTAIMVGLYKVKNLKEYFELCRGNKALELTKWFNTNYHYLVPDFPKNFKIENFKLFWNKPKEEFSKHQKGIPYLIGPFTFLKLSKGVSKKNFEKYLFALSEVYCQIVKDFKEVQIDEPAFVLDITQREVKLIKKVYKKIGAKNPNIFIFTYYNSVDFLEKLYDLPIKGIGLDFVNGKENFLKIKKYGFPKNLILICGLIQGRNIWKTDILNSLNFLRQIEKYSKNLAISNACPLYHLPVSLEGEKFNKKILEKIAFAKERLKEINLLEKVFSGKEKFTKKRKKKSYFWENPQIREKIKNLKEKDFERDLPFEKRIKIQRKILNLPLFPTTTIGSYPQTEDVREKRKKFKLGKISKREYQKFIKEKIKETIAFQEKLGLDVLVHGEFERTDMVEFFAQKLKGFLTTKEGWIISYGTRVYRPPIIYGDISRPKPMTLNEIGFAQSLTKKPVKGMLTGPVTILAWSFVREDIPIYEIAFQIALCLQQEIKDYEKRGIKVVQIDEPAFREKAPLKKEKWKEYFDWATKAFNLASKSKPETQIHCHMCYSEFDQIIDYILKMNFDVFLVEAARSRGDVIECFKRKKFKKQIGFGVWDIHSPIVPTVKKMEKIINLALKFFPKENLWLNPDCGLKTREWAETELALKNLVKLAKKLRKKYQRKEN